MDIQPGGHLDQLLRQTRAQQMQLSAMADLKANILLTAATVVITLSIRYLTQPGLQGPAVVLMLFSTLTVLLAAYAVMPKLPLRSRHGEDVDVTAPSFNLLFFGDFSRLDYPEFRDSFEELMRDPGRVYEAQVREIYQAGCFLAAKKYRFIRLAYLAFLTGLLASVGVLLGGLWLAR